MKYSDAVKEQAFQYYLAGDEMTMIAKKMKIGYITVIGWKKKFDWDKRREEVRSKANKKTDEELSDVMSRLFKVYEFAIGKMIQHMRDGDMSKPSYSDIARTIKEYINIRFNPEFNIENTPDNEEEIAINYFNKIRANILNNKQEQKEPKQSQVNITSEEPKDTTEDDVLKEYK